MNCEDLDIQVQGAQSAAGVHLQLAGESRAHMRPEALLQRTKRLGAAALLNLRTVVTVAGSRPRKLQQKRAH